MSSFCNVKIKEQARERLNADIEAYLKRGGEIKQIRQGFGTGQGHSTPKRSSNGGRGIVING